MVLTSTHNLCFGPKIRKIPCMSQFCYNSVIERTCFPDDIPGEQPGFTPVRSGNNQDAINMNIPYIKGL